MNDRPPLAAPATDEAWPVKALRELGWLLRLGRVVGAIPRSAPTLGGANAIVTPESYQRVVNALELPDRPLQLTRFERPEPGEAAAIARMARRAALTVVETFCDGRRSDANAKAMRDQHAKPHGCVIAEFIVRDDPPPELAVGVFQPGARYQALARFSNAQSSKKPDRAPDGRGMAIKLLNAPGPSLLSILHGEGADARVEQDFLMTNYPVFFGKNVNDYTQFVEIIALPHDGWGAKLVWFAKLVAFFVPFRLWQLWIFIRIATQPVATPLGVAYHSMTPYLLGDDTVVRYAALPRSIPYARHCESGGSNDNFLRAAMIAELDPATHAPGQAAVFDFAVMVRHAPRPDDIEDASLPWDGPEDRQVSLARLVIPVQAVEEAARWYACETASFSPWHCLPQHRPLGGLNRMRLAVYRASLEVRHRLNMVQT